MKALLIAPMGSVHRQHNKANIIALNQLDADVFLMANFDTSTPREKQNGDFVKSCFDNNIVIKNIPFNRGGFINNLRYIPQVVSYVKKEKFDIVHVHTETGGLFMRTAMLFLSSKIKYVYTPHGMSFWKGSSLKSQMIYRPLERWICSGMDKNLGMNQEEVDVLRKWDSKTAAYVHGIGLNLERFQKTGRPREEVRAEFGMKEDDKFIVSVGELDDNKNHITVIKALAMLEHKNFKYVVCGVGPNKAMLEKYAQERELGDKVFLAGYRSDIPDILNAADIFVFPSFHEGLPVSALEAMACGLPLACSKIRGNVDIVKDGVNGFLFEPEDFITLAMSLEKLMGNQSQSRQFGEKNKVIVQNYSLDTVVKELKVLYR